jgi:serine/threonine protein kinase
VSLKSQESVLSDVTSAAGEGSFSHPTSGSGGRHRDDKLSTGGRTRPLSEATASPASSSGRGREGKRQQDWQHLFQRRSELAVLKELKIGVLLGRGSYGRVYRARWKTAAVAVKIVEHSNRMLGGSKGRNGGGRSAGTEGSAGDKRFSAEKEGLLMTSMSHPNVVSWGGLGERGREGAYGALLRALQETQDCP